MKEQWLYPSNSNAFNRMGINQWRNRQHFSPSPSAFKFRNFVPTRAFWMEPSRFSQRRLLLVNSMFIWTDYEVKYKKKTNKKVLKKCLSQIDSVSETLPSILAQTPQRKLLLTLNKPQPNKSHDINKLTYRSFRYHEIVAFLRNISSIA